jgi:hypothetical protein
VRPLARACALRVSFPTRRGAAEPDRRAFSPSFRSNEACDPASGSSPPLRDKITSSAWLIAPCWSPQGEDRVTYSKRGLAWSACQCVSAFTLTGHSARAWIENRPADQRVSEGLNPVG